MREKYDLVTTVGIPTVAFLILYFLIRCILHQWKKGKAKQQHHQQQTKTSNINLLLLITIVLLLVFGYSHFVLIPLFQTFIWNRPQIQDYQLSKYNPQHAPLCKNQNELVGSRTVRFNKPAFAPFVALGCVPCVLFLSYCCARFIVWLKEKIEVFHLHQRRWNVNKDHRVEDEEKVDVISAISRAVGDDNIDEGEHNLSSSSSSLSSSKKQTMKVLLGLFLLSLLVSGASVILLLSHNNLLCRYSAKEFRKLCDFSHNFIRDAEDGISRYFLHDEKVKQTNKTHQVSFNTTSSFFWLHNSNLLAVMREVDRKNNCFISNDHDFDLCLEKEYFPPLLEVLRNSPKMKDYLFSHHQEPEHYLERRIDQKIRVYSRELTKLYQGHSGPWMIDIDECDYRKDPLDPVVGCNGLRFMKPSTRDSVKHLEAEYPEGDWRTPVRQNHDGVCYFFPMF